MARAWPLVCAVVLGAAGVGSGCKDSKKEDPAAAFIARYCDVYKPCCMAAGLPTDGAACRALFAEAPAYDAAAGEACLSGLQQASGQAGFCEGDVAPPTSCAQALGGSTNGACILDSDCPPPDQGDARCISGSMNGKVVHQCQTQTRGQLGSTPCVGSVRGGVTQYRGTSDGSIPAQGTLCDAADGLRCDGTACVALGAAGEGCSGLSEECVDGTFCDVTVGQCAARKALGAACIDQALECQDGAYCDAASMTCVAQLDIGGACTDNGQCRTANCGADGQCAATPSIGASAFCG
jgi:hypothetical protein